MAYSIQTAVSDGTLEVLDLSIKYMDKSHIFVYVDDVLVDGSAYSYVWLTDTRIQLVPTVANGSTLKVIRKTLTDEMWHEFSKGARFSTASMDENFEQLLFLAQEYSEGIYVKDFYTDIDLHLKRILNLGDPINDGDAVNLKTLKEYLPNADLLPALTQRIAEEELKSAKLALADGVWVHLAGNTVPNDKCGGWFIYTTSTLLPVDNGIVFAPAVGTGRLVRTNTTVITPYTFGGDPLYRPGADNLGAVQKAIDYLSSNGGGAVWCPRGVWAGPNGLKVPAGVSVIGEDRECTILRKTTDNTINTTIYAPPLVVYGSAALPSNINAVLTLTGAGGRYRGRITDLTLEGTFATVGNYESQKVEFSLVSTGSVSDSVIERLYLNDTRYGLMIPTIFASTIRDCRISTCLQATGIDDGTSLTYTSVYANNCRDSHFIRGMKYSTFTNNAADYTNDPAKYPDRTKVRFAYRLRSLVGCEVSNNGNEQTWGRSLWLETLDNCEVSKNVTIGVGSDYVGSEHIAVLYTDGVLRSCTVKDNIGYDVKAGGLLYGGANAANHHNIYHETTAFIINSEVAGNMVRATASGIPAEAGWGNNNPANLVNGVVSSNMVQLFNPTITANNVGDLVVTYGSGNKHYQQDCGELYHVFGCFDVGIGYTTASSYLIFQGFPANQNIPWRIAITGVAGGSGLTKKLASFVLNANQGNGITFDENEGIVNITDIPNNTNLKIYYDGWYARS